MSSSWAKCRFVFLAASTVILLGAGASNPAHADVIPLAGWNVTGGVSNVAFGNSFTLATNPPVPAVTISGVGGSASLLFSPTPTPAVTATASGYDAAVDNGAFAQGIFRYFGEVTAPGGAVAPTTVNVVANASLFSEAGVTNDGSDARFRLDVFGTLVFPLTFSDQGGNNGTFTTTMTVPVNTNQTFYVEMLVRAWTFEPGVSATAFLDPFFFLDQSLVDLGYALRFSDGMGNSLVSPGDPASVPVPAALPLFATGLGVVAFLARRRRHRAA
jgi:hypothetical protein